MRRVNKYRAMHIHVLPQNKHLSRIWVYGYLADEDYINSPELEGEFLVDKDTVGQYIGVPNKNGKEIYEGYIIKYGDSLHKVVFENRFGTAYFGVVFEDRGEVWSFGHSCSPLDMTVIGNIFDNQELLKGGVAE